MDEFTKGAVAVNGKFKNGCNVGAIQSYAEGLANAKTDRQFQFYLKSIFNLCGISTTVDID